MQPADLIPHARELALLDQEGRPRQVNLKRAMSTAYYAMFHTLCRIFADSLVGTAGTRRSSPAWNQAYRAIEHGHAKSQCKNQEVIASFPETIRKFAENFVVLQELRHEADYDPAISFRRYEVLNAIDMAEGMINNLLNSNANDRKDFIVWIAMKKRSKRTENSPLWLRD